MGTKLTGWLVPLPFLAWVILYRDRRGMVALVAGILLAFAVLVVLIPPWWRNPVLGLDYFLESNSLTAMWRLGNVASSRHESTFLALFEDVGGVLAWAA